jgi:hypothetical protein
MLDMVLCMLVPVLLRSFFPMITDLVNQLFTRSPVAKHTYSRTIEFVRNGQYWW